MKIPQLVVIKKYRNAISKGKNKVINSEMLSRDIGVYPEVIRETLSFFDPLVNMDYDFNLKDLLSSIDAFISEQESKKTKSIRSPKISKKTIEQYGTINDFIYEKMTISGFFERKSVLSDSDLKVFKKLITLEQSNRKKKK